MGGDPHASLHHIAGVDISFDKKSDHAYAMLAMLSFPSLEVVHVSSAMVQMTEPYIPGFLAFREVGFLLELLTSVREEHPEMTPQVIMVDGNGVLHPRGKFYIVLVINSFPWDIFQSFCLPLCLIFKHKCKHYCSRTEAS